MRIVADIGGTNARFARVDDAGELHDAEVLGMEGRTYCLSQSYDCTDKNDLLHIIAALRKFKEILETRLLD